jgi:hypothetical protein
VRHDREAVLASADLVSSDDIVLAAGAQRGANDEPHALTAHVNVKESKMVPGPAWMRLLGHTHVR